MQTQSSRTRAKAWTGPGEHPQRGPEMTRTHTALAIPSRARELKPCGVWAQQVGGEAEPKEAKEQLLSAL